MTAEGLQHEGEWRQLAEAQAVQLQAQAAQLQEQAALIDQMKAQLAELAELRDRVAALTKALYGKRSEKMPRPADELRKQGKLTPVSAEDRRKKREEAAAWKGELPEKTLEHPVPAALPTCELCHTQPHHPMPPKVSFEYEYVPGRMVRHRHVRHSARCECGSCIVTGPAPPRVGDHSQYGPGFVAHTVLSRCGDAMPLYRLAKQLKRQGVPVSPSTLGDLFHRAAVLLAPLYALLLALVRAERVVQGDETRIQVQAPGKTRRAWIWVFLSRALVVYVFSPSRSGQTPTRVLGATKGTLVVDAYTAYNQVCTPEQRERAGCLAHLRRKLFDALARAPAMSVVLDILLEVYLVEHEAKQAGIVRTAAHLELRQTRSRAAMDKLHGWLEAEQPNYLPSEPAGKAISYALDNWPHMVVFLDDVDVPPDNNLAEEALRIVAKMRDASLFVGHDVAGEHLAMLLSLVRTAEACGLNPQQYLADVLIRIQDHPQAQLAELLPQNWRPAQA